jgi:hypothetical protein
MNRDCNNSHPFDVCKEKAWFNTTIATIPNLKILAGSTIRTRSISKMIARIVPKAIVSGF